VDLDDEIEKDAGLIIAHIFEVFSEEDFRFMERRQLEKVAQGKGQVVGTGGGAVLEERNRKVFQERGYTILLRAEPEVLAQRIRNISRRPLLQRSNDVAGTLRSLWQERRPYYEASAHFILDTDTLSPDEVTDAIVAQLQQVYAHFAG
jgi:shikimate kinase